MARRKKRKAAPKRRRRRNPAPAPKRRRRRTTSYKRRRRNPSSSRGGKLFSGLNIKQAISDQLPLQIGIWSAKWSEKRFGPEASDLDPATWNAFSYAKGAIGGTIMAVLINQFKRGLGQKVLTGAIAQVTEKLIRNELIQRSVWAQGQFGQDDDEYYYVDTDAAPYMDGMPLDDRHRLDGATLVEPGPLGDDLEPVGALGSSLTEDFREYADDYGSM